MRNTSAHMASHLIPRRRRARHVAALGGAVGIALAGYVVVNTGKAPGPERSADRSPATSEPTVLGTVVTADDELPAALPASPVSIGGVTAEPSTDSPVTPRAPQPAGRPAEPPPTPPPPTPPPPTTTAPQAPPTLVPPTVIENTTTTTAPPTTTAAPGSEPEG